jgi:hypothetical protein
MPNSEPHGLSASVLTEIFSLRKLKITSEGQLNSVIWDFIELNQDRSHFSLLSFVRFQYLSASSIRRFPVLVQFLDLAERWATFDSFGFT